jgi:hypothetical protein
MCDVCIIKNSIIANFGILKPISATTVATSVPFLKPHEFRIWNFTEKPELLMKTPILATRDQEKNA